MRLVSTTLAALYFTYRQIEAIRASRECVIYRKQTKKKAEREKMEAPYRRHDISGKAWALLEPHLAGQRGRWGRIAARYAKNSDTFIAAVHVRCIAVWAAIRAWIVETISSEIVTAL